MPMTKMGLAVGGNEENNDISIIILRYNPSSGDNEYYRVDLIENNVCTETKVYYAGTSLTINGENISIERTTNHTFKVTALNDYYLYRQPSAYYPSGETFRWMWSYGQNGSTTISSANYRNVQVCIASRNPLTLLN